MLPSRHRTDGNPQSTSAQECPRRIDRADIREALAMLQFERGRREQARSLLDAAAEDLRSVESDVPRFVPHAERYRKLAEDFRQLGETERAEEMARRADAIDSQPPTPGRNPGPPRPPVEPK